MVVRSVQLENTVQSPNRSTRGEDGRGVLQTRDRWKSVGFLRMVETRSDSSRRVFETRTTRASPRHAPHRRVPRKVGRASRVGRRVSIWKRSACRTLRERSLTTSVETDVSRELKRARSRVVFFPATLIDFVSKSRKTVKRTRPWTLHAARTKRDARFCVPSAGVSNCNDFTETARPFPRLVVRIEANKALFSRAV